MKPAISADELKKMKRTELYEIAQKLNIKGRSAMSKAQLLSVLLKNVELEDTESKKNTKSKKVINKIKPKVEAKIEQKKTKKASLVSKSEPIESATPSKSQKVISEKKSRVEAKSAKKLSETSNKKNKPSKPARSSKKNDKDLKGILGRSFAQKQNENTRKKKGAEVKKTPKTSIEEKKHEDVKTKKSLSSTVKKADKHIKTTMEIPDFPVPLPSTVKTIGEDELTGELPVDYGEPRIVVQIRDPHWVHVYWELPLKEKQRLEQNVGIFEYAHSYYVLRVHNVSEGFSYDVRVKEETRGWYLHLEKSMAIYQVELGLISPTEGYNFIAISNLVQTPPDQVAEEWAKPAFNPEYSLQSKPEKDLPSSKIEKIKPLRIAGHEIVENVPVKIQKLSDPWTVYNIDKTKYVDSKSPEFQIFMPTSQPFNKPGEIESGFKMPSSLMPGSLSIPSSDTVGGSISAPFVGSSSENGINQKQKDFWLVVNTELIIYGATEPDANVTLQGRKIKLNPDGTFAMKFALPDGVIELPVRAVNADGDMERSVMPVVSRQTF